MLLRRFNGIYRFNQIRLCSHDLLYDILGVNPSCSKYELKKAWYQRCKQYHPDTIKNNSLKFCEIQRAYSLLTNNEERMLYDSMRGKELDVFIRNWKREFNNDDVTVNHQNANIVKLLTKYFGNKRELQLSIEDNRYDNTNFLYFILDGSASMTGIPSSELDRLGIPRKLLGKK